MQSGEILAPAKLNLTLEVLAPRPDGYHGIRSVVVPVALYDTLSWQPAAEFNFYCSSADLNAESNLVHQAATLLGLAHQPIALRLEKRIPVGAGLGGGSSDAAALLRAAQAGAFGAIPSCDWLGLAAKLGSDVPLFLVDGPALIESRGERVTALGANPAWHAVIGYPPSLSSTKAAYAELDRRPRPPTRPRAQSVSLQLVSALQRADFAAVASLMQNDFDAPIAQQNEAVTAVKRAFIDCAEVSQLSGSGSAVFALFTEAAAATECARRLKAHEALPMQSQIFTVPLAPTATWQAGTTGVVQTA